MSVTAAPEPPAEASAVFGARLELAVRYAAHLAGAGVERGLIGPREGPRLWDRHLLNCAAVSAAVPDQAEVVDLGSGAGLPGLVLAIARPDIRVTLVEPLLRRSDFLAEVVEELALEQVVVVRGRAEDIAGTETFNVVTARALAPLTRLLGWAMPLVSGPGELVAMKGSSADREIQEAAGALREWRCGPPRVEVLTAPGGSSTATVVRVAHGSAA